MRLPGVESREELRHDFQRCLELLGDGDRRAAHLQPLRFQPVACPDHQRQPWRHLTHGLDHAIRRVGIAQRADQREGMVHTRHVRLSGLVASP